MIINRIQLALVLIMSIFTNIAFGYVYTTCEQNGEVMDFFGGHITFNLTDSLTDEEKSAIKRGMGRVSPFSDSSITLVDNDDDDYNLGNDENEIYMAATVSTGLRYPYAYEPDCVALEADLIISQFQNYTTVEDSNHLPYVSTNDVRPLAGTALHEGGHSLGMAHEGRYYNMMGQSFSHVTRNSTHAYYGPGEDMSHGLIARYGRKTLDNSERDVGATVMRWGVANGDYSEHKFGVLRDSSGVELPVVGMYEGQYVYQVKGGESIRMELTLENNGEMNFETPRLGFYISVNDYISSADLLVGTDWPVLARGIPLETYFPVTIPSTLMEGYYFLGAYIDHDDQINEITSTNNIAWYPIDVVGIPDLIVLSPAVNDTTLFTGESYSFSAAVKNQGTGTSPATHVRLFESIDETISVYDLSIGVLGSVPSLSPGATVSPLVTTVTAPTTFGTYWIGACVIPVVGESPTTNNCSEGVGIGVYERPDLNVLTPLLNDSNLMLYPGQAFDILATVRNEGAGSSESTVLHYYSSINETISEFDFEIGMADLIGGMSSGGIVRVKTSATAPGTEGAYWVGACIEGVDGDLNSDNDCSTGVEILVTKEETSCSDNTVDPVIGGDVEYRGEVSCIASVSITTEPTVVLKDGANVYYEAPAINIGGGFNAQTGSIFRAVTHP